MQSLTCINWGTNDFNQNIYTMKKSFYFLMAFVAIVLCSCGGDEQSASQKYVDLGLPSGTKWATCNIGANSPKECGDYYAWGVTTKKNYFGWGNYKWSKGDICDLEFTKYCTDKRHGTRDFKSTLDPEDDVARVQLGENWRMPTPDEIRELFRECNWQLTDWDGVMGYNVKGPNWNSIFLPFAGLSEDGGIVRWNEAGYYWSNSLYKRDAEKANNLFMTTTYINEDGDEWRCYGLSVRPVYVGE